MAIQLQGGFLSDNGGEYDIYIYNDSFAGSLANVEVSILNIEYESQGDPIMEPLKASRCKFGFLNDSVAVDTFITNLRAGKEDQFKVVVEKEGDLFWCGVVLVDQMSFEDKPKSRLIEVSAIDGIGRLADIEFDYEASSTETFLKWIFECLEYNGLSQFYPLATTVYFKESCEFYDTQMTNTGTQYSPLLQTRCDRFLFLTDEVSGERTLQRGINGLTTITLPTYRPLSCADVLKAVLQIFSCRMFMSDGVYYIQQIRNLGASTYNERSIQKNLAVASFQTVTHRQTEGTDVKRLGDCRWANFPPLQEVRLDSIPLISVAQAGGGINQLKTTTTPLASTVQLGILKGGVGTGKSIGIRLPFRVPHPESSLPTLMEVEILFEAGSYRLYSTPQKPDIVKWTTTGTDRVTRQFSYRDLAESSGVIYIDVVAPEFPFASESTCSVTATWTTLGTWSTANYIDIYPMELTMLLAGQIIQEAQFKVSNKNKTDQSEYSEVIDYGVPLLNDITSGISSKNTFEVNSTGSTWVFGDVWDAGYTTDVELVKTLCLETMSFQNTAVELLQGTIKVPSSYITGATVPYVFEFWQTYYYDSKTYIFNGGTLNCRNDEFNGEWFEFIQNKSGIDVQSEDGDGYVYRGNDKVGTPKKNSQDGDKWTRDYVMINQIATIDTDTASGAITSISTSALLKGVENGDQMAILHPVNLRTVATLVVNSQHSIGATSILVDSITPSEILYAGYLVVQRPDQIVETDKTRTAQLVITDTNVPLSGGFGDGGNEIRTPGDGFLYYTDGSTTWKLTGTIVE